MMTDGSRSTPVRSGLIAAATILATVSPVTPAVGQDFEGVLTMRQVRLDAASVIPAGAEDPITFLKRSGAELWALVSSSDSTLEETGVTYYLKGSRLRSSPPTAPGAGPEYLILDFTAGVYQIVQPSQGIVIEWTRRITTDSAAAPPPAALGDPEPFEEGREINGFQCTGFVVDDGAGFVEVSWLTGDMPELTQAFEQLATLSDALGANNAASQPIDRLLPRGFPVLTVTLDRTAGTLTIAEVERVERRSLDDAMFAPPAGFATVSVQP